MVGRPASAAARVANSAGAGGRGRSAGAEGRGRQPHAPRAARAHCARAGDGGGCAGPHPAATIPPAALAAESWGRRCPGCPADRDAWSVAAQDGPGWRSGQGRNWLRAGALTWAPGRAPPPPGRHSVSLRRGGAGRAPGRAGSALLGDPPGTWRPDGAQVEVLSGALGGGEFETTHFIRITLSSASCDYPTQI
ncbi:putative uncharacterized protein ASB16-AS1 [Cynocephalus volans]|uniref:putative uncharacterized protein ASB16-AS1 n=1 Tax=Cynocephalus volans TaxID=110931 RepID=UPI002FC81622